MQFPQKIRGLRTLTVLWGAAAVIWAIIERNQQLTVLLALLTACVLLAAAAQRWFAGRRLTAPQAVALMGLAGLAAGAGTVVLALFLMAIKTGLHGHGPEFTYLEIAAVWSRLPVWALTGLLAGLGVGLISTGLPRRSS